MATGRKNDRPDGSVSEFGEQLEHRPSSAAESNGTARGRSGELTRRQCFRVGLFLPRIWVSRFGRRRLFRMT